MEIDLNKRWVKVYRYLCGYYYKSDLPKNGCQVGWELIFLPLIVICSLPIYVIRAFTDDKNIFGTSFRQAVVGLILSVLGILVGGITLEITIFGGGDIGLQHLFLYYLSGYILLPLITAIIVGFLYLLFKLDKSINFVYNKVKTKEKKEDKPSFLIEWFKAKKEKSCPQIKWKK